MTRPSDPRAAVSTEKPSLGEELGISDDRTLKLLESGLHDATGYQAQIGENYCPGISHKEYRQLVNRLRKALQKIKSGCGCQEKALNSVAQILNLLPPEYLGAWDSYDLELVRQPLAMQNPHDSHFEQWARALPRFGKADRSVLAGRLLGLMEKIEFNECGRGGGRNDARKYIPGIQCLARWFADVLPDCAISTSKDTLFYRYVRYWLNHYMGWKGDSPDRHIGNALLDL
ncbi:hypothetical protein ACNQFN_10940 [Thauera butanivorans]|uniref:hypothetical protein n=1 Tax=Thauera butanivorans TaxID=86174 RepID=UPI003AB36BC2